MAIEIKVGQKYRDDVGVIRLITKVNDNRVSYTVLDGKFSVEGGTTIRAFYEDTLIDDGLASHAATVNAPDGSITFSAEEAKLLKRLLNGYHLGKVGQTILDKLKDIKI